MPHALHIRQFEKRRTRHRHVTPAPTAHCASPRTRPARPAGSPQSRQQLRVIAPSLYLHVSVHAHRLARDRCHPSACVLCPRSHASRAGLPPPRSPSHWRTAADAPPRCTVARHIALRANRFPCPRHRARDVSVHFGPLAPPVAQAVIARHRPLFRACSPLMSHETFLASSCAPFPVNGAVPSKFSLSLRPPTRARQPRSTANPRARVAFAPAGPAFADSQADVPALRSGFTLALPLVHRASYWGTDARAAEQRACPLLPSHAELRSHLVFAARWLLPPSCQPRLAFARPLRSLSRCPFLSHCKLRTCCFADSSALSSLLRTSVACHPLDVRGSCAHGRALV